MISCSSWYCICSIVEYHVSSVASILNRKFLIDDIKKTSMARSCPKSGQVPPPPGRKVHLKSDVINFQKEAIEFAH